MRNLLALMVLLCGAASADAAEKPDHLLMLMIQSEDGQTKYAEELVQRKACESVGTGLAAANADKAPFIIELSTEPKVAGEVLAAACMAPNGDTELLVGIGPDDERAKYDALMKLIGLLNQRATEFSTKD